MKHARIIEGLTLAQKCSLLSGKDVWHTRALEGAGIPSVALSDGPSGLRKQAAAGDHLGLNESTKATCWPSASAVANSWDVCLAEKIGEALGREAQKQDVQILLGPGLNIKRSPLCGRNFEYFSEDPYLSGKLAAAYVRGIQRMGVSACPKHFAANSQETRRMTNDSVMDERTLREIYLTGFEIAVREGKPQSLMTAYNKLNGVYANENRHLLSDILRGEWGFEGMVVTDWGGCNDIAAGARAGSNLEMPGTGDDGPCELLRAVEEGRLDEGTLDKRLDELLDVILATSTAKTGGDINEDAHHALAREAAEQCLVLLKNEDDILPIQRNARVAVIGDFAAAPRYQGAGSSSVNATRVDVTPVLLPRYFPNAIGCAPGFRREDVPDEEMRTQACRLAEQADVVLMYLGLTEAFETEGLDRTHIRIPENQIRLLEAVSKVNSSVVVILSAGSVVEMPWLGNCKALVDAYLGGQAMAEAVLRVVSGQANPSGRLAETMPHSGSEAPCYRYYPGSRVSEYREGLYVGYRYYETVGIKPLFPFGFGLSYTSFEYRDVAASKSGVAFTLKNTGKRNGAEVAQVYVSLPGARVFRPALELKGFAKVLLKAGEEKRVEIPLDDKAFRYFNVKTNRWETEAGAYEIKVGASCEDIRLTATVVVAGTNAPNPYEDPLFEPWRTGDVSNVTSIAFETLLGRELPQPSSRDRLDMNDPLEDMASARNPVCRFVARMLLSMRKRSIATGKPDLNILFITSMPFRGLAKMMGGAITTRMAEDLLFIANGHWHRGLGRLIWHFFTKPRLEKMGGKTE